MRSRINTKYTERASLSIAKLPLRREQTKESQPYGISLEVDIVVIYIMNQYLLKSVVVIRLTDLNEQSAQQEPIPYNTKELKRNSASSFPPLNKVSEH